MKGRINGVSAEEAFNRLTDFASYAEHAPSIRSIEVEQLDEQTIRTKWHVNFRGGSMRWTEDDRLDPDARTIAFELVEGNMREFGGVWELSDADGGSEVRFACQFAVGMPAMATFIDPLAERAIRDNIKEILQGLFGPAYEPVK
jgi:ribosome-associated toxin RatA of RatAB toxin-antitoxin module